jgi:serine phosphatase RsbU (regulator of sigma subunit)
MRYYLSQHWLLLYFGLFCFSSLSHETADGSKLHQNSIRTSNFQLALNQFTLNKSWNELEYDRLWRQSRLHVKRYPNTFSEVANSWLDLVEYNLRDNPDKSLDICYNILRLEGLDKHEKTRGYTYLYIARCCQTNGKVNQALRYLSWSHKIFKKQNRQLELYECMNDFALIYGSEGAFGKAQEYNFYCMEIAEKFKDMERLSLTYNNIGGIYSYKKMHKKAMDFFRKSLAIRLVNEDFGSVATCYNNIGASHLRLSQMDSAVYYLEKFLALSVMDKHVLDVAIARFNLGCASFNLLDDDKAKKEWDMAESVFNELSQERWLLLTILKQCSLDEKRGFKKTEIRNRLKVIERRSEKLHDLDLATRVTKQLYDLSVEMNNSKAALEYHQRYVQLRDSANNLKEERLLAFSEAKVHYQKEKKEDTRVYLESIKDEKQKQNRQAQITYSIAGVMFVVILMGFHLFRQVKITRIQKLQIANQHKNLQHQHQEITDSINYARRIQNAILPFVEDVREVFPDSFMIYQPKDVVAGDFYWIQNLEKGKLFAVADCTGHGVPGAMVSVVCINSLNRCVREHGLSEPGQILDKTREIVIEEFEKAQEEMKDGMDIALCNIQGYQLEYAGANNPLWLLRNSKILELGANKQPIGKFFKPEKFKTHKIDLLPGDQIYLFSDGIIDQFGGPKGKKFKKQQLRDLILDIQGQEMDEQRARIEKSLISWMGTHEQIDDICMMGMKIA